METIKINGTQYEAVVTGFIKEYQRHMDESSNDFRILSKIEKINITSYDESLIDLLFKRENTGLFELEIPGKKELFKCSLFKTNFNGILNATMVVHTQIV